MVCDNVVCVCVTMLWGGSGGGGGGGGGGGAGYRIKNKNPTQRCGEKGSNPARLPQVLKLATS